jgi:hypothetical protein
MFSGSLQSTTQGSLQRQLRDIEISDGSGIFTAGGCQCLQ